MGRGPLTEHLADVIVRMINRCRIDPTAPESLVVGVDAPWGTGKTTLVHLLRHGLAGRSAVVGKPLVVNFDAWRESKVGPEWWALGATLYRGVRKERALAAQAAMIVWSALGRLARSKVFVGAVALLAVYAVFLSDSGNQAWVEKWQTVISAVTAAVAGAFGLSRLLFWSSPALGALYQKSDDAPLAEIAGMISRQRRWSPRSTRSQLVADSLLGVWVLLLLGWGLWLAWADDRSGSTFALLGGLALLGVGAYGLYVGRVLSVPKRPIIFVVDDLDRCTDEKTVAYLETIHTLVRHHERPRWFPRWRQPAPLIILVLADGRWVRNAFAKAYETFADVSGDETRGLGADFIQKLFDHTVIIPELTLPQASEYVRLLTESDVAGDPTEEADGAESQKPGARTGTEETARAAQGIAEATGAAHLDQLERSASQFPDAEADALRSAISVERSSEEYVLELTRHLMTKYSRHMPQNPRMIKRVANAWSMLQAVQLSIGSRKSEQELVAAAIFMTKYPNLVDQLLHHPTVPEDEGPWQRVDVMETRSLVSDPAPGLIDLAACYGKALLADDAADR
nr:P-loop NTPase fold protein [Nocardioides speluncae]